jgi:Short C-terminal domain
VFRRNKTLMRDGAQVQALVLEAKQFGHTAVGEGPGMGIFFELKLRVQFDDGTTDEITRRVRLASLGGTSGAIGGTVNVGDLLPVRYDPEDRSKIEIDSAAVKQGKEAAREAARERSKRLAIQRGEEQLAAASSPGAVPLAEIKAMGMAARTPVPGETGVEGMLRASIAIAARKGDGAEVTRLTAKLAEQRGTLPASQGEPSDPIDRLQKLADLHDRGVLTDAEFAAEKAKLLRES